MIRREVTMIALASESRKSPETSANRSLQRLNLIMLRKKSPSQKSSRAAPTISLTSKKSKLKSIRAMVFHRSRKQRKIQSRGESYTMTMKRTKIVLFIVIPTLS